MVVARRALLAAGSWISATLLGGCFGTTTPLAPGVSGSVGLPYNGVLTNAAELAVTGPGYARYRPYGLRNYGTPALVSTIERAAAEVERVAPHGSRLLVGDLSAQYGGKISGHASHRTGRDVDLLYYAKTLEDVPVVTPGFIHFGPDGLARTPDAEYLQLDVRREWLLVRALLSNPQVEILWIFASRDVEALLTDYAISVGEPADLVSRAIRVLHQPRDSANHDDHIHVRIACTVEERAAGCESGGPAWPWLRAAEGEFPASQWSEIASSEPALLP